jgi:hypothetical protein
MRAPDWQVAVIAKEPVPGTVKTRLCPPLEPAQAASLAMAGILDTLAAVAASGARRCVLVLDGRPGSWVPAGVDVVAQRAGPFGCRLQGAVEDTFGGWAAPVVVVGMDTPQVAPGLLDAAGDALGHADTVLGPAVDGGYWVIGTRRPVRGMFEGVPMSCGTTGAAQQARLDELGLSCAVVDQLRDVDHYEDAVAVARSIPGSRFATTLASFGDPEADGHRAGAVSEAGRV